MKSVTNLKHPKLEKLLESFSIDWQSRYAQSVSEPEKASLNSIVDLRNSMAHGGMQTTSYRNVKEHYNNVKSVIGHLKTIIRKAPPRATSKKAARP
jgi:hypothetical protein